MTDIAMTIREALKIKAMDIRLYEIEDAIIGFYRRLYKAIGFYKGDHTLYELGIELWEQNGKIVVHIKPNVYIRERRRGRGIDIRKVLNAKGLGHFLKGPMVAGKAVAETEEKSNEQQTTSVAQLQLPVQPAGQN